MGDLLAAAIISTLTIAAALIVWNAVRPDWYRWQARRAQTRCAATGHEWFPNEPAAQFTPTSDLCLRCAATRTRGPSGLCLGGHPMSEHYTTSGRTRVVRGCAGPR